MKQTKGAILRLTGTFGLVTAAIFLTACHTMWPHKEVQAPKVVDGLKLVLTEKGEINFTDDKGVPIVGVPPTELKGFASNEILNITNYTVIQLKRNPCYVLVCGRVCAVKKLSDEPCLP